MVLHSACLLWSHRVLRPLLLFVMELSIGDTVFYTRSTRLRVPAKVAGLLHDGHVEVEYDQGGMRVTLWTPSLLVSPFSSVHFYPDRFLQLTLLRLHNARCLGSRK